MEIIEIDDAEDSAAVSEEKAKNDGIEADSTAKEQAAVKAKADLAADKLNGKNLKLEEANAKASKAKDELDKIKAEGEIEGKEANTEETLTRLNSEYEETKAEQQQCHKVKVRF